MSTKRPQNCCKDCDYTWYPKGKSLSRSCPNCGSRNVSIAGPGIIVVLIGVLFVGFVIFKSGSTTEPLKTPKAAPTEVAKSVSPKTEEPKLLSLTSTDGRTIEAELLNLGDISVTVKRRDGKEFVIPFSRLSAETQTMLKQHQTSTVH